MTSLPLTRSANVAFHFSGSLASWVSAGGGKTSDVGLPGRAGEKGLGGARVANHNTMTRPLASTWEPVPGQCGAHLAWDSGTAVPTADKASHARWARATPRLDAMAPEVSSEEEPPEGPSGECSWGNGENEPQGPHSFSPACLYRDVYEILGTSGQMKTLSSWKDRGSDFSTRLLAGSWVGRRPRAAAARSWRESPPCLLSLEVRASPRGA